MHLCLLWHGACAHLFNLFLCAAGVLLMVWVRNDQGRTVGLSLFDSGLLPCALPLWQGRGLVSPFKYPGKLAFSTLVGQCQDHLHNLEPAGAMISFP